MALITNNISGSAAGNSVIGITGSIIVANEPDSAFPGMPGSDVVFFVSGGVGQQVSSFGGDVVVSGSVIGLGGLSGSLTTLVDGTPYLLAGSNVTLATGSNGAVTISSTGGGGGGSGITQITGSLLASGSGVVGGTVVNIDGQPSFYGQYAQGFIDLLMLEPSFNPGTNGKNFNMIAASSTNPTDSMAILSTNRNPGSSLAHLYIGKTYNPSQATIRTEVHSRFTVASYINNLLGTTVEEDNYSHVMTTIASSLAFTQQERFTGNFTTDGTNQGSLLLEAAIPAASGGATLTIRAFPYPSGPGSRSGRLYVVSDVLGTLSPTNALSVADAQGRTFNGAASPYVMDSSYSSSIFILDSTQNNWIVFPTQSGGGGGGSGSTYFDSTVSGSIYTSGSAAFVGGTNEYGTITSPTDKGADVFFYVSGSQGSANTTTPGIALFGGDVVISGSLNALSGTYLAGDTTEITGDVLIVSGALLVSGATTMNGDLIVTGSITSTTGFSGSLTTLVDGTPYLITDNQQITIATASNGAVHISGQVSQYFFSTQPGSIYTTGSSAFSGGEGITSPSQKGADVFFYVSGAMGSVNTSTAGVALFGGDIVVSGSLNALSGAYITGDTTEITGNVLIVSGALLISGATNMNGDLTVTGSLSVTNGAEFAGGGLEITGSLLVSGNVDINGNLVITGSTTSTAGFSGSLTTLIDGTPYLVSDNGQITITTASNGAVHINGQVPQYFFSTQAGSIYTTGSAAFSGAEGIVSPSQKGTDVFFYVSGSKDGNDVSVFGGNVRISGSLTIGTASVTITSNDVQFGSYGTRIQRTGNDLVFYDGLNPNGLTLHQIGYPTQFFDSATAGSIYTTGSVSLTGQEGITSPSQKGSDVTFYVSGSVHNVDDLVTGSAEGISLFGGSVVISGSMVLSGSHLQGENFIFYPELGYPAGKYVHAVGNSIYPIGNYVTVNGAYYVTAIGDYSHAEGEGTWTDGYASHAEGQYTYASSSWSHAEGYATTSSGSWSHAEGLLSIAYGSGSHAEGNRSNAWADYSHGEGYNGNSRGIYSHAEGVSCTAWGSGSHAEGFATHAYLDYSHAEGYVGGASGSYSHTEGVNCYAYADGAHAEGYVSLAYGYASHTEGAHAKTVGGYSHAEGYYTVASGSYSHAEGQLSISSGSFSHAEGNSTVALGAFSHTEGNITVASGSYSHAEGYGSKTIGDSSHAEGYYTITSGSYSHAGGFITITSASYQTAIGKANTRGNTTSLFVVGNGTGDADANRSDIFRVEQSTVQVTGSFITSGSVTATAGLSGSLTKLADGTSYIIAGSGMSVVSASNGAVTLSTVVPPAPVLASYSDSSTQPASVANTAYYVKYDTTEMSQGGMLLQNNGAGFPTRIVVPESGIYEFQYSAQLTHTGGTSDTASFWLTKNRENGGGNIPRSNSFVELGGSVQSNFPFLSVFLTLSANDYVELAWSSDNNNMSLTSVGTQVSPTRPENPSIIVNIRKISV